jgi:hypothetical protein
LPSYSAKKLEKSAEMLRNGVAESPESTSSTKSYTGKKRGRPSKADLEARAAVQKSKIASEDEEADKVLDEVLSAEEEDKISVLGQAAVHAEEEQVVGKIELA